MNAIILKLITHLTGVNIATAYSRPT